MSGLFLAYTWLAGFVRLLPHAPWLLITSTGIPNQDIAYLPVCLFKAMTHLPCAFCGLTRSFTMIWQGHWQQAMDYHLLGFPFFLGAVFLTFGGPLLPEATRQVIRFFTSRQAVYGCVILLVLCWLWKLAQNPVYW
ncbi:MAG TPA: DUF2752 domain-containing protein [Coleofasciculaceae cyanobacterium]|jgi:hypothetical protein